MTKKLAILYYGQLRLNPRENENFDLLIKNTKDFSEVDIYVHTWSLKEGEKYKTAYWSDHLTDHTCSTFLERLNYVKEAYKPVAISVESQRDFDHREFLHPETSRNRDYAPIEDTPENISIMLSQLYSVNAVCRLIPPEKKYDTYVLLRNDFQYLSSDPVAEHLFEDNEILCRADFINIFKHVALSSYQNLLQILKEKKINTYNFVNSPCLRKFALEQAGFSFVEKDLGCLVRKCRSEVILEYIDTQHYHTYFNDKGIYIRKSSPNHYCCRVISSRYTCPQPFRWIGQIIPKIGTHNIKFKVKFTKRLPSVPIGSKSHSPDIFNYWSEGMKINTWKEIEIKVETFRYNELFIFVFLDNYFQHEDLEFELQVKEDQDHSS